MKSTAILILEKSLDDCPLINFLNKNSDKFKRIIMVEIGKTQAIPFPKEKQTSKFLSIKVPYPRLIADTNILSKKGLKEYANRVLDILEIESIINNSDSLSFFFYNFSSFYLVPAIRARTVSKIITFVDTFQWEDEEIYGDYISNKDYLKNRLMNNYDHLKSPIEQDMMNSSDLILCHNRDVHSTIKKLYGDFLINYLDPLESTTCSITSMTTPQHVLKETLGFDSNEKIILFNTTGTGETEIILFLESLLMLHNQKKSFKALITGHFNIDHLGDEFYCLINKILFTGRISRERTLELASMADVYVSLARKEIKNNDLWEIARLAVPIIATQHSVPQSLLEKTTLIQLLRPLFTDENVCFEIDLLNQYISETISAKRSTEIIDRDTPVEKVNVFNVDSYFDLNFIN